MTTAGNIALFGLIALLLVNGARLTFFPETSCGLVHENEITPLSQSVMEFHREQEEKRNAPTE